MFNYRNKSKLLVLIAVCLSFGAANLAASGDFESLSEAGVGELRVDASMLESRAACRRACPWPR